MIASSCSSVGAARSAIGTRRQRRPRRRWRGTGRGWARPAELRRAALLFFFEAVSDAADGLDVVGGRAELLAHCLPEGDALERTVDSHISKLRKKLEALGIKGMLYGVRGVGYRLWE